METLYDLLQVAPTASTAEISTAYRRRALETHPDRTGDSSSQALFQQVQAAFELLRDATRRREYDASLRSGRAPRYLANEFEPSPSRLSREKFFEPRPLPVAVCAAIGRDWLGAPCALRYVARRIDASPSATAEEPPPGERAPTLPALAWARIAEASLPGGCSGGGPASPLVFFSLELPVDRASTSSAGSSAADGATLYGVAYRLPADAATSSAEQEVAPAADGGARSAAGSAAAQAVAPCAGPAPALAVCALSTLPLYGLMALRLSAHCDGLPAPSTSLDTPSLGALLGSLCASCAIGEPDLLTVGEPFDPRPYILANGLAGATTLLRALKLVLLEQVCFNLT